MRYNAVLKKHGYLPLVVDRKMSVYQKESVHKSLCVIKKKRDKGVCFDFIIKKAPIADILSEVHYNYLVKEAEQLKKLFEK